MVQMARMFSIEKLPTEITVKQDRTNCDSSASYCAYIKYNGNAVPTNSSITIPYGDSFGVCVASNYTDGNNLCSVSRKGTVVKSGSGEYTFTPKKNCTVVFTSVTTSSGFYVTADIVDS